MLYLGCVFTMLNKSCSYKNQLIRSAAGWSKGRIMLSLIPADAYMKPVSGIKMNFPSIEIDSHPSRRAFSLDQQPGSHTILSWPRLHWWTLWDFLSFLRPPTPQLWLWTIWANPMSPACILQKAYQKHWMWSVLPLYLPPTLKCWEVTPFPRLRILSLELALKCT